MDPVYRDHLIRWCLVSILLALISMGGVAVISTLLGLAVVWPGVIAAGVMSCVFALAEMPKSRR